MWRERTWETEEPTVPANRIALVTGANRGIGYEIARQLGGRGFHVLVGVRNSDAGKQAVASLQKGRATVEFVELNVSERASIQTAAKTVTAKFTHLNVLVNNAGVMDKGNSIVEMDDDSLLEAFTTNALGSLRVTQAFLPLLLKSNQASVINMSSGLGQLSDMEDDYPAYSISKTALNAVTRQFAAALRDKHITVNSVCPGWVKTDMGGPNAPRTVEQGADTVTWLATDAPRDLTGQFLRDRKAIAW